MLFFRLRIITKLNTIVNTLRSQWVKISYKIFHNPADDQTTKSPNSNWDISFSIWDRIDTIRISEANRCEPYHIQGLAADGWGSY